MSDFRLPPARRPFGLPDFRRGPAFRAFNERVNSRVNPAMEQISDLSPARRIELAGGSTGQQRFAQNLPRYQASSAAADVYGLEEQPSKGALESFMDFALRPQRALTGVVTGLLGMEREGEESRFGRIGTALTRGYEGLVEGEDYRFSEFTDIGRRIERGEDVSLPERAWNSALGFVIDTAVDPLTYISFGGSIMGRMRASQVVRSKSQEALKSALANRNTDVYKMLDDGVNVHNTIRTEQVAKRMDNIAKRLSEKDDFFKQVKFDPTNSLSDLAKQSEAIYKDTGVNILRDVALDTAPEIAASVYARGGQGGLRNWAIDNFGRELGEGYFRQLPKDIQGGIRIRMPFVRDADKAPISFGIEGIGAGRLSEKSQFVKKLNEMTQTGRDIAREKLEPLLGKFSGSAGEIYYEAVVAASGRRRAVGTASSYVDFTNQQYASARMRELRTLFDQDILRTHQIASRLYEQSVEKFGVKYQDSFFEMMYDTDILVDAGKRYKNLKEYQKSAYNTAKTWRDMLDSLGAEAVQVFGEAGKAMNFLQNYVPRVTTGTEIASRQIQSVGAMSKGATPDWTKHRAQWPMDWKVDDTGVARVVKWRPNHDIKRLKSGQFGGVYEVDPRMWMGTYLTEMRHALNDQILVNELIERGFVTKAARTSSRKIDEAETRRRVYELLADQEEGATGRKVPDSLQAIERRLLEAESWVDVSNEARARSRALSSYLKDQGVDFLDVEDVNLYILDDSTGANVYRNVMLDDNGNSLGSISQRKGKWEVFDSEGNPILFPDSQNPAVFDELREAQSWLDNLMEPIRRESYYKNYLPTERASLHKEVLDLMANPNFSKETLKDFDDLGPKQQQALIDAWLNALRRFGRDNPQVTVTKGGQPAFLSGPGMQPIDVEVERVSDSFREWLENKGYQNIAGISFDPDGTLTKESQTLVKDKIAKELGDTYGPVKVTQALQRMFEVQQNPQGFGGKLYNDYYKPFYSAQKAWMTLGRGPGFVSRNILGGTWNNFLADVGYENTMISARVLGARKAAQTKTQDFIKQKGLQIDPLEVADYYRTEVRKNLSNYYEGEELDLILDAWESFSRQGLGGNRETARLYGDVLRSVAGRTGNRPPTAAGDVAFGPRAIGQRTQPSRESTFRISPTGGTTAEPVVITSGEDLNATQRFFEFASGDNYWIRDVMSPMVEMSEDYLRFASFMKGVKEIGLEDPSSGIRGYAASLWVKATQFDYADLSAAEESIKMLIPFYTWTRYNVPLQVRAVVQSPGKVAQALRIHESLGDAFGEDDALEPSYVSDKFGITIDENSPLFSMLPDWAKPKGDVTLNLTWGEPLGDINTYLRDPFFAARGGSDNILRNGIIQLREIASQLNPGIVAASEFQRALAEAGQEQRRNVQDAPKWARALGIAYEDPTEPGRFLANSSVVESIRQLLPVIAQSERMLPWVVGGDREPGRWTTSMISNLFGLPTGTTDDWKKASEMNRRSEFVARQLRGEYGSTWESRMKMVRRLTDEGAPVEFIDALNLREADPSDLDVMRAVHAWRMMRRIELLIEDGVPEDEILASLSVFVPEDSKMESLVQTLWKYVPKPPGDFERGVNHFGLKPITRQEMEEFGLTVDDIRNMTDLEQRNLIYWVNRNRGWTGPRT